MNKYLSTYYFHGQDLCIVPRHVREDIAWMKDRAVDGVFVGVHDADVMGGNIGMVCDMIREAGMDVWLIPSRVGGLVAGWGRQPSHFSVNNPEFHARQADGSFRRCFGPQVSVFHPGVPEGVADVIDAMLEQFPATGIVWDELKTLDREDHSDAAKAALGGRHAEPADMVDGTIDCFSKINRIIKDRHADLKISCFVYADIEQPILERCAGIDLLDEFGCDGKCHKPGEADVGEGGPNKVLMGGYDQRFAAAAKSQDCVPFTLLETQLLDIPTLELSLSHLPEFLAGKEGHLAYYYYPYGLQDPERFMPAFGDAIAEWRQS